jgi:hypothetical protein
MATKAYVPNVDSGRSMMRDNRRDFNMRDSVQSVLELIVSSYGDARDGSLARSMEASLERIVWNSWKRLKKLDTYKP